MKSRLDDCVIRLYHGHNRYWRLRAMLAAEAAPLFAQLVADNFDEFSLRSSPPSASACRTPAVPVPEPGRE
jgi:hypothetical protein